MALHILRWLRRLRPALPIILIAHPKTLAGKKKRFAWVPEITLSSRSMTTSLN